MKPNVDAVAKKAAEEIFYEWQRPQSQHRHVVAILMDAFYRGYERGRKDREVEMLTRTSESPEVNYRE